MYEIVLGAAGLVPFAVDSGGKALMLMEGSVPDLVVVDLDFSGSAGADVVHHMRTDPRLAQVPIILTAESTDLDGALRGKASLVLQKPVACTELEKRARALVQRH